MTIEERRHYMVLLRRARCGDVNACERLTEGLARQFAYMIRGYSSSDPAYDWDDLHNEFRLGIWSYIDRVDDRGDPLFHLAWRGQRAVGSLLNTIKQRRQGTPNWVEKFGERSVGMIPEGFDPQDGRLEHDPVLVAERHEEREEARRQIVHVLAKLRLTPRQHDVVDWMATDPDFMGEGSNLRLAERLGVSPQAASKHRKTVLELMAGAPAPVTRLFTCIRCRRSFRSSGALTQHKNGQSGHKPCTSAPEAGLSGAASTETVPL